LLPVGGTAGQVLSKINSTDYNTQWTTPSAGGSTKAIESPAYVSSRYYASLSTTSTTGSHSVNSTRYIPFYVWEDATFNRIAIRTSGTFSGSSVVRLGLYNNGSDNLPSTVVFDAGTVSCTASSTLYEITISQTISKGWYWLAANTQTVATTNNYVCVENNSTLFMQMFGLSNTGNTNPFAFQAVTVTGGFATATSVGTTGTASFQIFLRKS
jgi:hypothetical protein